jgi:hypothetical protein
MGTPSLGGPPTTTTWAGVLATTPTFGSCTVAFSTVNGPVTGLTITSFTCNGTVVPAQFDATTYNPVGTGTTTGSLRAVGCTYVVGNCSVVVTGKVPATYANSGTLTVLSSGQGLHASWNNVNSVCRGMFGALNNASSNTGPATLTATGGGNLAYAVTTTPVPTISG